VSDAFGYVRVSTEYPWYNRRVLLKCPFGVLPPQGRAKPIGRFDVDNPITTTKICTKCGLARPLDEFQVDPRYKGGRTTRCRECTRLYHHEWAAKNSEKERERWRRQREEHPEAARERTRKSYRKHAEKRRAERREYGMQHRAQESLYRAEHHKRFPFKKKQNDALIRARRYGVEIGDVDYERVLERDNGMCHLCGSAVLPDDLTFDHLVPMSKGGPHTMGNVAVAHYECNRYKRDR
jgi:5-methylcytosine-specific restriction endonuclease McrA